MQNNKHLNEILRLILAYRHEEKINDDDLNKIKQFITNIEPVEDKNKSVLTNHTKFFSIPSQVWDIIPSGDAKNYLKKFADNFDATSLLNRTFGIKSTLLFRSLNHKKNVTLRLISHDEKYEIAHLVDGKAYLIDCLNNSSEKEIDEEQCKVAFEEKLGKELDKELFEISKEQKTDNTRVITIPYNGNFDKFTPDETKYINLIPSVIEKDGKYQHQFTFLMYFDTKPDLTNRSTFKVENVYYDTFQLCPPC